MKKLFRLKTCVAVSSVLALVFTAVPVQAHTYYFAMASDDTMFVAVDIDSIKDIGDNKKSAEIVVIYNGARYDGTTKYAVAMARYDCKNHTADSKLRQNYDASGTLVRTIPYRDADSDFQPVYPDSIAEWQLIAVCDGVSATTQGFSKSFDGVQTMITVLDGFYVSRHPK